MEMQALQAAIALSETVSVDSDTSKVMETCTYQRRGRKQAKPSRALDSTEAPAEFQHSAAPKQQQSYLLIETSSGDSPILNNQAGCEDTAVPIRVQQSVSSSKSGSKNSPAHRQGPCGHCKTPYSPQWRKGPRNKPVLCNACGIRYLRNRHLGRSVPQKKRSSMPTAKTAAGDSSEAGEDPSVDTLTDTTDMRGPFKKRKTKKGDMGDEDTSAYSYDDSGLQETMGSVGSFQQLLLQQHVSYRDTERACADADTAARRGSDVSQSDKQNCAGPPASMQAGVQAKQTPGPTFSTSVAMPGNMQQQLLAPMQSLASSSGIYGGGYSMALALQLYQQQQHQLLLNQQLLMSQASTEASGLQTQGSSAAGSAPGSPAHSSAGQAGSAQANLLSAYNQSLQMQQLQGYLLQQQQHAHVLQAAGMLHGPSPLSVMSSGAVSSSLALGGSGQLSALQAPVSTAAVPAAPAVPSLEITPLVCGEKPVALSTALPAQAHAAAADPAAAASIQVPAKTGNAVLGSFQSLLAA